MKAAEKQAVFANFNYYSSAAKPPRHPALVRFLVNQAE
jgi:hypothetical protein